MYSNCTLPFQMPSLQAEPQAEPSRPSRGVERRGSARSRGGRRAPVIEEESSEEEESAHLQLETSADSEGDSGSGSGSDSGDDAEDDSEGDGSDSDDDDGAEVVPRKRT